MNSIRNYLTRIISAGLTLIIVLAGVWVYFTVRSGLIRELDSQLAFDTKAFRLVLRGIEDASIYDNPSSPRVVSSDPPNYATIGSGQYYQIWNADGGVQKKSTSLGEKNFPFPGGSTGSSQFSTIEWDDGTRVRIMEFRVTPEIAGKSGRSNRPIAIATLAREMNSVDRTLSSLLVAIGGGGLLAILATVLMIRIALDRGLGPLGVLGRQTAEIDANSLDVRFDASDAPTELEPIYGRMNNLMERLEKSFERERRLSADLAHELRTPLAELKMMCEFSMKWPHRVKEDSHREYHEVVLRLERMIDSLFALARWESGRAEIKKERIQPMKVAETCWTPLEKTSLSKLHSVEFEELDQEDWNTDPDLVGHIFSNLLANAVAYTPEHGSISVRTSEIEIVVANSPHHLNGKDLPYLFERHWRGDKARSDSKHAGLGLTLAANCAEVLGFQLEATIEDAWLILALRKAAIEEDDASNSLKKSA